MLIDRPEPPVETLMTVIKGPDFPTREYIYGLQGIRDAYTTGRGTLTLRAKAHAEKLRGGRETIIITGEQGRPDREGLGAPAREEDRGHLREMRRVEPRGALHHAVQVNGSTLPYIQTYIQAVNPRDRHLHPDGAGRDVHGHAGDGAGL